MPHRGAGSPSAVPEFDDTQFMGSPFGAGQRLVSHFIKANQGQLLIQLLDPALLMARLFGGTPPAHETDVELLGK